MRLTLLLLSLFLCFGYTKAQNKSCDNLISACDSALAQKDTVAALKIGEEFLACDSLNSDNLYAYGMLMTITNNWYVAMYYFNKAFIDYNNLDAAYMAYNYYEAYENYETMVNICSRAIRVSKTDYDKSVFYYNRGRVEKMMDMHYLAYNDYLTAYKLDPTYIEGIWELGLIHSEIGKTKDGLKYFFEIIKMDSTENYYRNAYHNISYFHMLLENYDSTLIYAEKSLSLSDTVIADYQAYTYNNMAHSFLKTERPDSALYHVDISIQLDSTNAAAYYNKGLIMLELGDTIEACHAFKDAEDRGFVRYGYAKNLQQLIDGHCRGKGIFVRF